MSNTPVTQALLPVTQADRDAAAQAYHAIAKGYMQVIGRAMEAGAADEKALVQLFARHRLSHSLPGDVGMREAKMMRDIFVDRICLDVGELPDRSSPDDWPDAMLVTAEELALIINTALDETNLAALTPAALSGEPVQEMHELPNTPPTPDRIGKDAVREALAEILPAFRKFLRSEIDGDPTEREMQKFGYMYERASAALSAAPAQEGADFITVPPPDIWKDLSAQPVDETERLPEKCDHAGGKSFLMPGGMEVKCGSCGATAPSPFLKGSADTKGDRPMGDR